MKLYRVVPFALILSLMGCQNSMTSGSSGDVDEGSTVQPTPNPSPIQSPTPNPSPIQSPTPNPTPKQSPTPNPTPKQSPTPNPTPKQSPTPKPTPSPTPSGPTLAFINQPLTMTAGQCASALTVQLQDGNGNAI